MSRNSSSSSVNNSGGGNDQIVPLDQNNDHMKPQGIMSAISNIQHFYIMESDGESISSDFLTLEGMWEYFRLGFRSGFSEGIVLFIFLPLMEFYLLPFVLKNPSLMKGGFFSFIPYMLVAFNTMLCFYISKFYIGTITRKTINSLFYGRTSGLLIKATVIWTFWYTLYGITAYQKYTWWVATKLEHIGVNPYSFFEGFNYIRPQIMISANKAGILLVLAALGPYGIVFVHDWYRQWRESRINRILNS